MTDAAAFGHKRWATEMSRLLTLALGEERFPISIATDRSGSMARADRQE